MILVTGYACRTGLGYLSRRLVDRLPAERWLVVEHNRHGMGSLHHGVQAQTIPINKHEASSDHWSPSGIFDGALRAIVAAERVWPRRLFFEARRRGVRTVLLVMAEWFHLGHPWVPHTDVFVTHTQQGYEHLCRMGLQGRTVLVPMPLDLTALPFRHRLLAKRFVFCNGWGGVSQRKGLGAVLQVLERDPKALTVQSQLSLDGLLPPGVSWKREVETTTELYAETDVAVQPSRWEGVGLQLLEAMAVGCPVLTTDAPPMSDYVRQAHGNEASRLLVPATMGEMQLGGTTPWPDAMVSGVDLLKKIDALRDSDIRRLSAEAREYVEDMHGEFSWKRLREIVNG